MAFDCPGPYPGTEETHLARRVDRIERAGGHCLAAIRLASVVRRLLLIDHDSVNSRHKAHEKSAVCELFRPDFRVGCSQICVHGGTMPSGTQIAAASSRRTVCE
jgi:hypothetical protein